MNKAQRLKDDLYELFIKVKNKKADIEEAKTLVSISNSICSIAKTELEYAKFNKPRKSIGRPKKLIL